jgi:hypothetical protein
LKIKISKILLLLFFLFSTKHFAQHLSKLNVSLNKTSKIVTVSQELTYFNQSNDTLSYLILNDWNNAYSDENSLLGERFADEFERAFLLSDVSEKGFTKNISITNEDATSINWCRLTNKIDLIEVKLDQKLFPNEKIKLNLKYVIKLPNLRFTGFGYDDKGNFHLKDCFLTPARYEDKNGFLKNSNANINDNCNGISDYEINFTIPANSEITSDLNEISKTENTVTFSGKNRLNFSFFVEPKSTFISFKNSNLEVVNNLKDNKVDDIQKAIIINRIVEFAEKNIGKFPNQKLIVSQADYNQNPFYGLNQLPSFLSPFPNEFLYELKFVKTYLNTYVRNSINLNQRTENWIYDGIEVYLMMKYMNEFYPDSKMMGNLSKYKILKGFNLINLDFNEQYSYYFMLMARKNLDQSLNNSKEKLIRFNEKIASKNKAGLSFNYLDSYLENNIVPKTIKEFYTIATQKQVNALDFETLLKSKSPKKIDWFFNKIINSREISDFKFGKIEKTNDSLKVQIKNKTCLVIPVPIYGLKNNQIVFKQWLDDIKTDSTFTFDRKNADKIVLNYKNEVPEFNLRNNWKNLNNFWGNNRPYKFAFMKDLEDARYNQLLYVPSLDYNIYDGLSPGLRLHTKTILDKPFVFDVNPMYSTKTKSLSGVFSIGLNKDFRNSNWYNVKFLANGSYFHYAPDATYFKINPTIVATIRDSNFRDNHRQALVFRYNIIKNQISNFENIIPKEDYSIANFKYYNFTQTISNLLSYVADIKYTNNFSTLFGEMRYRKLLPSNRQINVRLFAGTFLHNKTQNDQYSFGVSRPNDYLYEYNLLGRSETKGFASQEFFAADGGFKSKLDTEFSNKWLLTSNLSYTIWNYIELYGDIGIIKNQKQNSELLYDNGVRLNLVNEYLELFFPVYSNNGWEISQPKYAEKIRFVLAFSPKTLLNLFTRKWF